MTVGERKEFWSGSACHGVKHTRADIDVGVTSGDNGSKHDGIEDVRKHWSARIGDGDQERRRGNEICGRT